MLPRWHIFWGATFSGFLWLIVPEITYLSLALVFLSSVFIDLDHYLCAAWNTKKIGLNHAFKYQDILLKTQCDEKARGIRRKGDFHLFHTLEFHILVAVLSFFYTPALYVFVGMIFHSIMDIGSLINSDYLYRRELLFIKWIKRKNKKKK